MSNMRCDHCGAEVTNGLALCELSQRFADDALAYLAIYFRNLSRWRPGRAGSRPVPGSRVLYDGAIKGDGTGDRISDTLDATANMLTTRARMLADDRGRRIGRLLDRLTEARDEQRIDEAKVIEWLCAGFRRFLTSVSTLDWAGDFVTELGEHEERLRALTPLVPGWYAGPCAHCTLPLYVVPGTTWVTCSGCNTTTHIGDHRDKVLAEARDWIARPKPLAEAVVALVDTEPSVQKLYTRIRQWSHQEALVPIRQTARDHVYDPKAGRIVVADVEVGHARYRLGDVLDLVLRDTRGLDKARAS